MSRRITAIYENGVLRPLTSLELPEHSEVEIDLQQAEAPTNNSPHHDYVRRVLVTAGVSLPAAEVETDSTTLTAGRRGELARLFAAGRPLSELISEDREGR